MGSHWTAASPRAARSWFIRARKSRWICATFELPLGPQTGDEVDGENAYVVALEEGGPAVFVDSGADVAPLIEAVERWGVTPVAILRTHSHHDHVVYEDELAQRYSIPVLAEPGEWRWDDLHVQALATPGHSDDGLSFVIDDGVVATGDTLFRDAVGGGDLATVRRSVMDVLLELPDTTRVLPGHADETTIGR